MNLRLHIVDGVRGFDLQSDGLPSECLNKICIPPRRFLLEHKDDERVSRDEMKMKGSVAGKY